MGFAGTSVAHVTNNYSDFTKYLVVGEQFYADLDAEKKIQRPNREMKYVTSCAAVDDNRIMREADFYSTCRLFGKEFTGKHYLVNWKSYYYTCVNYGLDGGRYVETIADDFLPGIGREYNNFTKKEKGRARRPQKPHDDAETVIIMRQMLTEMGLIRKACEMMVRKQAETNQKLLDVIGDQNAMHSTLKDFMGAYNGIGGHVGGDVGMIQKDVRDLGRLLSDKLGKTK